MGKYTMIIAKDVNGEVYQKLIRYALDTSDAVMAVITNRSGRITTTEDHRRLWLKYFPHIPIPDIAWENWKKDEDQMIQKIAIYKAEYHPYIKLLSPFMIKKRHNTVWPSRYAETLGKPYTIALYHACDELYPLLLIPGSYFAWNYPYYPEDLSFFENGRAWLYGCSHEKYFVFLPRSREDYDTMLSLGIPLDEPYAPVDDDEWFYEEYVLQKAETQGDS